MSTLLLERLAFSQETEPATEIAVFRETLRISGQKGGGQDEQTAEKETVQEIIWPQSTNGSGWPLYVSCAIRL